MRALYVRLTWRDWAKSHRGSPTACLVATAARRQWGGQWEVTATAANWSKDGMVRTYRPTAAASAVILAFDTVRMPPLLARRVKLIPRKAKRQKVVAGRW